jgi:hypothetical protein
MAKLKYGVAPGYGEPIFSYKGKFLGSDVLSAKSGRYVVYDISDGYFRAVNDGENRITGYVEQALTCDSTSGNTVLPIATNVGLFATEMPYSFDGLVATLTQAVLDTIVGKLIDIYVLNNIQYADNRTVVADNVLQVVGGDVAENTLYVVVVGSVINQIA